MHVTWPSLGAVIICGGIVLSDVVIKVLSDLHGLAPLQKTRHLLISLVARRMEVCTYDESTYLAPTFQAHICTTTTYVSDITTLSIPTLNEG